MDQGACSGAELERAFGLDGVEGVAALMDVRQRIDAEIAERTAALDATGSFEGRGYRSPARFLTDDCRVSRSSANSFLKAGRTMKQFPLLAQAAKDGVITFDHVKAFTHSVCPPGSDADRVGLAAAHEADFLELAKAYRADEFRKLCQIWRMEADYDNVEAQQRIAAKTHVTMVDNPEDGTAELTICGPRVDVILINEALSRLSEELWRQDNADRADEDNVVPLWHKSERRFRAAVLMVKRAMARAGQDLVLPEPLLNLQMDWGTFERESEAYLAGEPGPGPTQVFDPKFVSKMSSGTPMSPSHMFALSVRARIRRVVFGANSLKVDLGRASRLFVGPARVAVQQRDQHCQHPGCTMPAAWCDVDHITEWQHGGTTTPENGQLLCRWHHTRKAAA